MSYLAECCKELLSGGPMEFKTNGPLISELANKIAEISGDQTATVGAMNKIIREALEVVAGMGAEPQRAQLTEVIAPCNGEHSKFEEWAAAEKYDMQEHPIHYLFTDPKTYAARQGWKAALRYVSSIL